MDQDENKKEEKDRYQQNDQDEKGGRAAITEKENFDSAESKEMQYDEEDLFDEDDM